MFKTIIIVAIVCVVVYFLRRNFRRAWYVLRTGDEHPDWEKLDGEYFVADWERKRFEQKKAAKGEAKTAKVSE